MVSNKMKIAFINGEHTPQKIDLNCKKYKK